MALVDSRVTKQAEILVNYSLKVKRNENIIIFSNFAAKPLVYELYRLLVIRGANEIRLNFNSYELDEIFLKNASERQLTTLPKTAEQEMRNMDCYIRIGSSTNTRGLTNVKASNISKLTKTFKPIQDYRIQKTRWVVTRFPTNAQAQEADMSLSEYEDFVFSGINGVDWRRKHKEQEKLKKLVDKTKEVHIVGPNVDLHMSNKGRKAENAGGKHNMPDGEVFTSVVEDSVNGFIKFTYPALYLGREFHEVRLQFSDGKVIKANATKGEKDLNKILDMDKGSRFVGEIGFGNNFKIDRFTKDILFDEKIGGSIHIALGKGYKETGSKNESALHWDMIRDLRSGSTSTPVSARQGGELWFDDKLVQKDGKWLV